MPRDNGLAVNEETDMWNRILQDLRKAKEKNDKQKALSEQITALNEKIGKDGSSMLIYLRLPFPPNTVCFRPVIDRIFYYGPTCHLTIKQSQVSPSTISWTLFTGRWPSYAKRSGQSSKTSPAMSSRTWAF